MSEANRQGNVEGALYQRPYLLAVQQMGSIRTKGRQSASGQPWVNHSGSTARQLPTDTHCSTHKRYYPKAANHSTATCRAAGK